MSDTTGNLTNGNLAAQYQPAPTAWKAGDNPSIQHDIGQIFGHALNALPGYSSLGANITNPNVNYRGVHNSGMPSPSVSATAQQISGGTADANSSGQYLGSGSGSSANGGGTGNKADISTYTDNIAALNNLLTQADTNNAQGQQTINNSYDRSNKQLNDQQTGTMNNYQNQENNTTTGYQNNLNTINNQARSGYQSLQSLLGGSGSAGEILAPMAVSNQAGGQTNTARDSFATNLQSLATARKDANMQYKNAQDNLLGQKNDKLSSLISSIDQQKQNYLGQIGQQQNQLNIAQGGSYQTPTAQNADIASLQAQMNGLSSQYAQPAFTPQNVNVQAPNLNPYVAQAAQIGGGSNQPQGAAPSDPATALAALLQKDQTQKYNPYGA